MTGRTNSGGEVTATIDVFPYEGYYEEADVVGSGSMTATATVFESSKVLCQVSDVVICEVNGSVSSYGDSFGFGYNRPLFRSSPPIYVDYGAAAVRVEIDQSGTLTATLLMFFPNGTYAGQVVSGEVNVTKIRSYSAPA